jgi:hypothetical protein
MRPLIAKEGFQFGCDPEFFIVNAEGKPVSAAGLIPGTKEEPYKVDLGAVQVDGMAAEFNIDPVTTFEDWDKNIVTVMAALKGMLPKGYKPLIVPSVEFAADVFDAAPDTAKELGCTPDFDAWTGEQNMPPSCEDRPYLRTASGHVHIGWTENADLSDVQHMMNCRDLVKQFDWYLAAWSLKHDEDPTRRLLYGKAGAMRPKPYGVEYRTLSNFWIGSKGHRLEVWNRMVQGITDMRTKFLPESLPSTYQDLLRASINKSVRNPSLEAAVRYPINSLARTSIFN